MIRVTSVLLLLALVCAICGVPAHAGGAPGFQRVRAVADIEEYRLEANGLTVLLKRDTSAPVVAAYLAYGVGSRNEGAGTTGYAHLLEHMMFKGTARFSRALGNGVDRFGSLTGSTVNAATSQDYTVYHALMGRRSLAKYLAIEADRMRGIEIREADLRSEMPVVRNEYERNENSPEMTLDKEVTAMAYMAHPYHHPIIGWQSDIENVSVGDLTAFYNGYYWPDNATLTIVGDFERAPTLALVRELFEAIPRSVTPVRPVYTTEPVQTAARRVSVQRPGEQSMVQIVFRIPNALHADLPALDVLAQIVAMSPGSRLKRAVVDKGFAAVALASVMQTRDPGLFHIKLILNPGTAHRQVEELVLAEIARLRESGVSAEEVRAAIRQKRVVDAINRDGVGPTASQLSQWTMNGDWTRFTRFNEQLARVTPADVQRVASQYLLPQLSTTGWLLPLANEPATKVSSR